VPKCSPSVAGAGRAPERAARLFCCLGCAYLAAVGRPSVCTLILLPWVRLLSEGPTECSGQAAVGRRSVRPLSFLFAALT